MAKQGGDFGGDVNLGTDAWNVADGYTKLKILRQLIMFDRWDTATNEKIERQWVAKGIKNPHYAKLTTFRGVMKYPKLRDKSETMYQSVKDAKRNLVAKEEMGINDDEEKSSDPYVIGIDLLKSGKIRNGVYLDGFAVGHNLNPESFRNGLRTRLKKEGIDNKIVNYYWETKAKEKESGSI